MSIKDEIQHPGVIESVSKDKIEVNILAQSACSSCHAKGMCSVSEMENKIIEVNRTPDFDYKVGDQVTVYMRKSLGPKAVLLGYFYPFLIVLLTLIVLISVTGNEGLSALIAFLLLVPYYFILYKMKDKLSKTFEFKIR